MDGLGLRVYKGFVVLWTSFLTAGTSVKLFRGKEPMADAAISTTRPQLREFSVLGLKKLLGLLECTGLRV